ncbi:MAG: hypothetical protein ABIO70_12060, partial [Pseudomonadota bacterium]
SVGVAFVTLQLWPPLGEAWCALFGGHHMADAGDLLCLPALAGAWWCWREAREPRAPRRWALVVATGACLATVGAEDYDWRYPCDSTEGWDPAAPLVVHWAFVVRPDLSAPGLRESITVEDEAGRPVPLLMSSRGIGLVLCPEGGLAAGQRYTWRVRAVEASSNHLAAPSGGPTGVTTFTTSAGAGGHPASSQADCDAIAIPLPAQSADSRSCDPCAPAAEWASCDNPRDTGDTGEPWEAHPAEVP